MTKKMRVEKGLLKIGEVSREARVPVSMVRYYTEMGLLKATELTGSGYRLYDKDETLDIIKMIMVVKNRGPSLNEIATRLDFMEKS